MNELERTKERMERIERMIIQIFERLQVLEMDNVKNKSTVRKHINNPEGHKI